MVKIEISSNRIFVTIGALAFLVAAFSMWLMPIVWYAGLGLCGVVIVGKLGFNAVKVYHVIKMDRIERRKAGLIHVSNGFLYDVNSGKVIGKEPALIEPKIIDGDFTDNRIDNVLSLTDKAYHFMLIGDTGSGKTTLASAIIDKIGIKNTVICDPHANKNEWPAGVAVYQDYESIAQVIYKTFNLLQKRYDSDKEDNDLVLLVIDELPSVTDELKELGINDFGRWIRRISREGRKVDICLMLLSQGATVSDLDQKGYSSMKRNFIQVHLNLQDTIEKQECLVEFANGDKVAYSLPEPVKRVKPKILQLNSGVKCANPDCDNPVKSGSKYCQENYNACKQAVYRLN